MVAADLFDSIIINDELSISDMPPVQLPSLYGNSEEETKTYIVENKPDLGSRELRVLYQLY